MRVVVDLLTFMMPLTLVRICCGVGGLVKWMSIDVILVGLYFVDLFAQD